MTDETAAPRKVLAVMDDSEGQIALLSAAQLADRHGAQLVAFACIEPPHDLGVLARLSGRDPERLVDTLRGRRRAEIEARLAQHLPGRAIDLEVAVGKTFVEIVRHVIDTGCDFVVKAAEPLSGGRSFLFASTDQHLLRKCPCPVWLQTDDARPVPLRVLAAVDVDAWDAAEPGTLFGLNRRVVRTACTIAAPAGGQVIVLHAWEAVGEGLVWAFTSAADARLAADAYVNEVLDARHQAMGRLLAEVQKDCGDAGSPPMVPRLIRGTPERVIGEQARALGVDVVVMGTVARTGLSGVFIGNTAENIINNLECPILAVKPDGFVSPLDTRRTASGGGPT